MTNRRKAKKKTVQKKYVPDWRPLSVLVGGKANITLQQALAKAYGKNKRKKKAKKARTERNREARPAGWFKVSGKLGYARYLRSRHWHKARLWAIRRLGPKCQICGRNVVKPHVHHRNYKNLWREELRDLQFLCGGCHATHHLGVAPDSPEGQHLSACAVP